MNRNTTCSECGGTMQQGYVPDSIGGNSRQSFWVEGSFEKDFLGFPKYKGRKKCHLTAYRCEQCGLVKFYAGPDQTRTSE